MKIETFFAVWAGEPLTTSKKAEPTQIIAYAWQMKNMALS
jgi:hypothetical protein